METNLIALSDLPSGYFALFTMWCQEMGRNVHTYTVSIGNKLYLQKDKYEQWEAQEDPEVIKQIIKVENSKQFRDEV